MELDQRHPRGSREDNATRRRVAWMLTGVSVNVETRTAKHDVRRVRLKRQHIGTKARMLRNRSNEVTTDRERTDASPADTCRRVLALVATSVTVGFINTPLVLAINIRKDLQQAAGDRVPTDAHVTSPRNFGLADEEG
jgi:hypothetical protein